MRETRSVERAAVGVVVSLNKLLPTKRVLALPRERDAEPEEESFPLDDEPFAPPPKEFVTSKPRATSPKVRQAGADPHHQTWVKAFREKAERHLYVFTKSVLGRLYLTQKLHLPLCKFLQDLTHGDRKMALFPRECGKTTIVSHALPLHIIVQPRATNIYFPGEHGCDQRIVIASKAARLACDSLRIIQSASESNQLLKTLWPERFWEDRKQARSQSKAWSNNELILPRDQANEWPDPTFRAVGVGAAITGSHPSVLIKDDLINEEDHSSPIVMQTAIQWHTVSRALINRPGTLEFIIGTRWHIHDLYQHILSHEPSVQTLIRSLVEYDDDGEFCIYPEFVVTYPDGSVRRHGFSPEKIAQLRAEFGTMMFSLQYMNDARDPSLVDFQEKDLREYHFEDAFIVADDQERDIQWADMRAKSAAAKPAFQPPRGPGRPRTVQTENRLRSMRGRPAQLAR